MKENDFFRILRKYIVQNRYVAGTFLLFSGIFLWIFYLYGVEAEPVWYAFGLCILAAILLLSVHFAHYYKRYHHIEDIRQKIAMLSQKLPKVSNLMEEELFAMVDTLQKQNQANSNEWRKKRQESIDYYTTWVHQIKAPIAAMKLVLQGQDTEENKELLAELFRIEQYVEMVLTYFRLDSTSSDFVFREYPLDELIRKSIRKFAPQFVRKKISLHYEPTEAMVLTDEKWLRFILEQVLSNGLKYTDSGSITISVDERKMLRITDTGIGIAPEDLPRIFEKGFTGYNGRANKKSTGLGLYLCKKTADKLSHKIGVESQAGHGTTLWLDLHSVKLEVE
ncbi:MAG: sensor histidine kinase [Lachnospiraceae bacterium]|nr:sensor histidine kinase [Lachnospiraceae bacterium]